MASTPTEHLRPLRREEYDKLVELGAFHGEHIELLEGQLVVMSPSGPPHYSAIQKLGELLIPALMGRATVRIQGPSPRSISRSPSPMSPSSPLATTTRRTPIVPI